MGTKKPFRILCIDGGGVRGVIPAVLLQALEESSQRPLHELFDLIVGTSSGGLIALSVTLPRRFLRSARYTAADLVHFYKHYSKEIFKSDLLRKLATGGGLWAPKYSRKPLDSILAEFFGDIKLHEALIPVGVPIYSLIEQKPILVRSRANESLMPHFSTADIAMACTAAPTYFAPKEFHDFSGKRYLGVDGGIFSNNPQFMGVAEAYAINGAVCAEDKACQVLRREDIQILSLGTGRVKMSSPVKRLHGAGVVGWVVNANLIDMMMSADSDCDNEEMSDIYKNLTRLQIDLPEGREAMDNGSKENMNALIALANTFLDDNSEALLKFGHG